MSGPFLTRRFAGQAAGSFVTGSPLPQALIQRRQPVNYELRLRILIIRSWSTTPAAGDSYDCGFHHLVGAPEMIRDTPSRHIPSHLSAPRNKRLRTYRP